MIDGIFAIYELYVQRAHHEGKGVRESRVSEDEDNDDSEDECQEHCGGGNVFAFADDLMLVRVDSLEHLFECGVD